MVVEPGTLKDAARHGGRGGSSDGALPRSAAAQTQQSSQRINMVFSIGNPPLREPAKSRCGGKDAQICISPAVSTGLYVPPALPLRWSMRTARSASQASSASGGIAQPSLSTGGLRSRLRATWSGLCGGSRSQVNRWLRAADPGLLHRGESCDHGLTGVPEPTPNVPGTTAPVACSS